MKIFRIKSIVLCIIALSGLFSCAMEGEIHIDMDSLYPESSLKGWYLTENNTGLCGNYDGLESLNISEVGYLFNNTLYINIPGITISKTLIELPIIIEASGVTIDHCLIKPTHGAGAGVPIITVLDATILDSDIDCTLIDLAVYGACIAVSGENCIIERCNIRGGGTGISIQNTSTSRVSVAQGNYIHELQLYNDNHIDGITIRISPGLGVIVRNNYIKVQPNPATGPLFIQPWAGHINNVLVEGNFFQGYGYGLALEYNTYGYGYNMLAKNNRFDPWEASNWAASLSGGPGWYEWTDNYMYRQNAISCMGTAVQEP